MSPRRYGEPLPLGEPGGLPYSKGMMARALIAAGVSAERAYELATRIELDLAERGARSTDLERLEELAGEVLGDEEGPEVVERLRRYAALQALDLPIVLLVGGATGTGKSTVATEAAHRLGITRVTSTDFIRQTIRAFFSAGVHAVGPLLELRGRAVGGRLGDRRPDAARLPRADAERARRRRGVRSSARSPRAGRWCSRASTSCPGMVPRRIDGVLVVHAVLAIESEDVHRTHFHVRDSATGGDARDGQVPRPARRYP